MSNKKLFFLTKRLYFSRVFYWIIIMPLPLYWYAGEMERDFVYSTIMLILALLEITIWWIHGYFDKKILKKLLKKFDKTLCKAQQSKLIEILKIEHITQNHHVFFKWFIINTIFFYTVWTLSITNLVFFAMHVITMTRQYHYMMSVLFPLVLILAEFCLFTLQLFKKY